MANKKNNGYLKKKTKRAEILFESDEDILRRAEDRLEQDAYIISPAYRVENFSKGMKLMQQLPAEPEAKELYSRFAALKKEAEGEKKAFALERAKLHLSQAQTEDEFHKCAEEFSALKDYEDAQAFMEQAHSQEMNLHRKGNRGTAVFIAVLILIAVCAAWFYYSGLAGYAIARVEGANGLYESARNRFRMLGDFLDSEEMAELYDEKYQGSLREEEKVMLSQANEGEKVEFGDYTWVVYEKEGTQLTLILEKAAKKNGVFAPAAYNDKAGDVTWEESSLREYLNSEGLKAFSDTERSALIGMEFTPSSNEAYGTNGGNAVTDLIRIPDIDMMQEYLRKEYYSTCGSDVWLCSPGQTGSAAAFVTRSGLIMEYGDDVTDASMGILPVVKVDYELVGN